MRYSVSPCNNVFHGGQFFVFRMTLALQSLAERTSYRNLYHHLIKTKNFYPIFSFFCQMTNPDIRDYWEKSFYKKKKRCVSYVCGWYPWDNILDQVTFVHSTLPLARGSCNIQFRNWSKEQGKENQNQSSWLELNCSSFVGFCFSWESSFLRR